MTLLHLVALAAACLHLCFTPATAFAASLHDDVARIDTERIDQDAQWIALLHYRARRDGSLESEADRPQFFMAGQGKQSPRAELLAAVAALHAPEERQGLACRFPARYEWLRARLGHDDPDNALDGCPALSAWLAGFPGRQASIVFASSYLESPSSTFGHTFLRIVQQSGNELLSPTINYAARTEARDGDLAFVSKGLFGGFPGVADELPFYRRLRTYTEIEGRDLHDYALALAPDEVRRLLLHTWEIKDGIFDYYFLDENCAYRTLALIDAARPRAGLLRRFHAVTVPVDTIRTLRAAGLLGEHRVWPSVPKAVRGLEAELAALDAAAASRIALGQADVATTDGLAPQRQAKLLRLAYEYGSVLIDRDQGDRVQRKEILGAITRARLAQPAPAGAPGLGPAFTPEDGHDGGLVAIGALRRAGRGLLNLEYAAFEHTLADPLPGYEPHAAITLLHPSVELGDGKLRLREVDWLTVQSAIPSSTLFAPQAWRVRLRTARRQYADGEHTATSLAYHAGKAWQLGGNLVFSVLPGASIDTGSGLPHRAALAGVLRNSLGYQDGAWSLQLDMVTEKYIAGSRLRRQALQANAMLRLSRNLALTIGAAQRQSPRREGELLVSLRWRQRSLRLPWEAD